MLTSQTAPKNFTPNNNQGHCSIIEPNPYTEAVTINAEPDEIPKKNGRVLRHPNIAEEDITTRLDGPGVMILRKVKLIRLINNVKFIIIST
tara:strand:- start:184 stop:456 length:273 start_codon:yes stop_codon:yes gene_type:complete